MKQFALRNNSQKRNIKAKQKALSLLENLCVKSTYSETTEYNFHANFLYTNISIEYYSLLSFFHYFLRNAVILYYRNKL